MARSGPPPDPRSVNRNPGAEWVEVVDLPFDYVAAGRALPDHRLWAQDTRTWFHAVASMPQAVLWRDTDWLAIYDLALLKQAFYTVGCNAAEASEMRRREDVLGLTYESRVKNRIRYVEPAPEAVAPAPEPDAGSNVTTISSARDRLRSA